MCGIVGLIDTKASADIFSEMLTLLSFRGPDALNYKRIDVGIHLGHARLSIIDLSDNGLQPMSNEDDSIWLTFNGEIYNYKELRSILLKRGHVFKSDTDSEVIIHAYEEWGIECLKKLNGMFAFGLVNLNTGDVIIARDRVGIKPLYYYHHKDCFAFASQPRSICKYLGTSTRLSKEALHIFFILGYVPETYSAFHDIHKLAQGSYLKWNKYTHELVSDKFWQLSYKPQEYSFEEAIVQVKEKIGVAVERQLVSDVPVGVFLSGGIRLAALKHKFL